jgi:hypothetical protein
MYTESLSEAQYFWFASGGLSLVIYDKPKQKRIEFGPLE